MNKDQLLTPFSILFLREAASNHGSHHAHVQEIIPEGQSEVISSREDVSGIASTNTAFPSCVLSARLWSFKLIFFWGSEALTGVLLLNLQQKGLGD